MDDPQLSINLPRYRDLTGRRFEPWFRRVALAIFAAIVIAGLVGAVGQPESRQATVVPAAKLQVTSPSRVRGGLLFQSIVTVHARRAIEHPQLVLNRAWLDGLTVNTIEPQASQETNTGDGGLALQYGKLDAGDTLRVWFQYQVNPTTVGSRTLFVELDDGDHRLASLKRDLRVFP